ncbi:MAG: mitofilin family membrane protein [Parvibaculum sp.]|uniref:COG4223 family protein n=1 Tax=Parvibaculum sp. TaxID=2024848 RepID=UPI002ABC0EB3|nr:mitofilin family membrane protein [Parvibaculum sp.]MDZ4381159.1 mitofilin family membrane protein [Parvibaculum sp.]
MSNPDDTNKDGENVSGSEPGEETQAEYLKPEGEARPHSARRQKEPRILEGTAEHISEDTGSDPEAERTEKAAAPKAPRSPFPLVLAAGIAGLGGAAVALVAVWSVGLPERAGDRDAAGAFERRLAALESGADARANETGATIASLGGRIDRLEEDIAAASQTPDSAVALREQIDALAADTQQLKSALNDTRSSMRGLESKVGEISQGLPPAGIADQVGSIDALVRALDLRLAALAPDVEKMEERVGALEQAEEDPDAAARAALGLALANLARAVESAGPFETELRVVETFLPDEPALGGLAEAAAAGVPTRAALEARFPMLAQSIFDAERHAGEDGWWSRFVANAKSLITVRRTGEISGDTTEAKVARMEERLKVHDLAGAVVEAEALEGPAAETAAPWIADARDRLDTDRLVRDLSARVASQLAQTRG